MSQGKFDKIIEQIARDEKMTVEEVVEEMRSAMDEAQKSTNPWVRARWASIPRKGEKLTVEEFAAFIAEQVRNNRPWP